MNEEKLKQILDSEEQAQAIYEKAVSEAKLLPEQAEISVSTLLEKTRQEAETEAAQLIERICNSEEIEKIAAQYAKRETQRKALAEANQKKAIEHIIEALLGEEQV